MNPRSCIRASCLSFVFLASAAPGFANANTAATYVTNPVLASIHEIVLEMDMSPFPTYSSTRIDEFEAKMYRVAEDALTSAGFVVVQASWESDGSRPRLTFSVRSLYDDVCPEMAALHVSLTLTDEVTITNRRVGKRVKWKESLWDYPDPQGDLLMVKRGEVNEAIQRWVIEAVGAFTMATKHASGR
jgi:hypothetical protein